MSKAASIPSAVRRPLSFERGSLALFGSLAVLIAGLVSLDTGLTGVGLFILGGLLGIFIGVSLLYLFTSLNDWIFYMPLSAVFGSITFCALVGLFFGIWPAKRAAKLDPAVSLRYE